MRGLDRADWCEDGRLLGHRIERFKQRIQWVILRKELLAILDGCKAADFVLFVVSSNTEVDNFGESIIRGVEAQGVSTTLVTVQASPSRRAGALQDLELTSLTEPRDCRAGEATT